MIRNVIVGAGTDAGAILLIMPGLDLGIVEFALKHDTVVLAGALRPTEITAAWR